MAERPFPPRLPCLVAGGIAAAADGSPAPHRRKPRCPPPLRRGRRAAQAPNAAALSPLVPAVDYRIAMLHDEQARMSRGRAFGAGTAGNPLRFLRSKLGHGRDVGDG